MDESLARPPQFSIVLPTHNRADVLPFALRSVLGQTLRDFELLVVGDGCTDHTADVVKGLADPRVRWFDLPKAPHLGYANRNIVLRQAWGEFIAFMAHDDLWLPDHLELLLHFMQCDVEWVYSRPVWVTPDARIAPSGFDLRYPPTMKKFLAREKNYIPSSCVMHRRECLAKYGYWNEALPARGDWDMWIRMIEGGGSFAYCPEPTCLHFHADWRKKVHFALDHEKVWERFYELAGFLPPPLDFVIPPGTTEQEAIWQIMSIQPQEWSRHFRTAVRQALDQRVTQSDELMSWLLNRWPALQCDAASVTGMLERVVQRQSQLEADGARSARLLADLSTRHALLAAHVARMTEPLIEGTLAWKLVRGSRRLKRWLLPPGSGRERTWLRMIEGTLGRLT